MECMGRECGGSVAGVRRVVIEWPLVRDGYGGWDSYGRMISGLLLKLVLGARKGVSEGWMQAAESVLEGIEGAFQSGEAVLDVAEGGGAAEDVAVVGGGFG